MKPNRSGQTLGLASLFLAFIAIACAEDPEPARPRKPDGTVPATVASFAVVTRPQGTESVERIAVARNGRVRLPDEKGWWRLFDIESHEVITVDEIARTVRSEDFDDVLDRLRTRARQSSDAPVLRTSRVEDNVETVAGYRASMVRAVMGRGYEREMWVSDRTLIHSDLFLLLLATDAVQDEDLPSLRSLIELLDGLEGYPVIDRSRMELDGVEYQIERRLITVADQEVPAGWFEIPEWAEVELRALPVGRQPAASPLAGQNARGGESRSSGSGRTDP